jgi:hypothetical protein
MISNEKKTARVIILAGQSNAVGVGFTKYLPEHFDSNTVDSIRRGYENIKIRYVSHDIKNEIFEKVAINQTEKSKDTLGPEVGIAKKLTEKYPEEEFYIVKCAVGGVNMANDWRSPSSGVPFKPELNAEVARAITDPSVRFPGWCYNECVKLLDSAFEQLKCAGLEPEVIAFCWMQGESDSGNLALNDAYIGRYDALLKDLAAAFPHSFDNCRYIDAAISQRWDNYELMNERKRKYAEGNGHFFVDTVAAGLTTKNEPYENPDTAHYDCESTVRLGEMFAENIVV